MNAINTAAIFSELRELADDALDDRLLEKTQELKDQGSELRVETSLEEPEFITDPSPYTEVIRYCEIWIGQSQVYDWQETYWGSFGGNGAGWWVEQSDTSIDGDVQTLLELLELLPETPDVPRPDSTEEAEDD
jgi:hypothetical protein